MLPQISIVDDDPLVRDALQRLCKSVGYEVEAFESAEDFLEAGLANQVACLLLDVHLPGRNGLELQAELASSDQTVPIVFVTAHEDEQARSQALEQGAIDFLQKPLDTDRLLEAIDEAIRASEK